MREERAEEDEITQFIFHRPKLLGQTPKVLTKNIFDISRPKMAVSAVLGHFLYLFPMFSYDILLMDFVCKNLYVFTRKSQKVWHHVCSASNQAYCAITSRLN